MFNLRVTSILLSVLFFLGCGASNSGTGPNPADNIATESHEAPMVPTIYRLLVIQKEQSNCPLKFKKSFFNSEGQRLQSVCPADYDQCRMEGSCDVIEKNRLTPIGYLKNENGRDLWRTYDKKRCPYGSGYHDTCLDPYRSVAADLKYWHMGDVIFVSAVEGIELPDGSIHDGYFVVRDTGGVILGPNRFDFFVGRSSQKLVVNIFSKLKLNDKETQILFRRATRSETDRVLEARKFPNLPISQSRSQTRLRPAQ